MRNGTELENIVKNLKATDQVDQIKTNELSG